MRWLKQQVSYLSAIEYSSIRDDRHGLLPSCHREDWRSQCAGTLRGYAHSSPSKGYHIPGGATILPSLPRCEKCGSLSLTKEPARGLWICAGPPLGMTIGL
jgi:hypothetical protein